MTDVFAWLSEHTLLGADPGPLVLALLGALTIGLSKSGLSGTATLSVVLMAQAFGAKPSVGLVLPLLIAADLMGYLINRHGGSWRPVWSMVPPAMLGVVIGWFFLDQIDNTAARSVIGWLTLGLLAFKLILDWKRQEFLALTEHPLFSWIMGLTAGVTTMLANAAGPVMTVYLLSKHLEKKDHIGVFVRFFLFINLFKVPFSADLGIINGRSLMTNLVLLPAVVGGILLGWQILQRIPQKSFEWLLFGLTLFAALWLIF
ncbi:MAG: sulfite exporter TauE/SafE family protein [Verrucomicrobiales bacterium]|nr:sulfite exporter TauE/SafE family protein [Verrucomicrobiales bacterium]